MSFNLDVVLSLSNICLGLSFVSWSYVFVFVSLIDLIFDCYVILPKKGSK